VAVYTNAIVVGYLNELTRLVVQTNQLTSLPRQIGYEYFFCINV